MQYAIIDDSGRQFKVAVNDILEIDRTLEEIKKFNVEGASQDVVFDRVLLVGGEGDTKIGSPIVAGAKVTAQVVKGMLHDDENKHLDAQFKDKKVMTIKYSRRKGYHRKIGHRQSYLRVKITGITA